MSDSRALPRHSNGRCECPICVGNQALRDLTAAMDGMVEMGYGIEARYGHLLDVVKTAVQELPLTRVDSVAADYKDGPSRAGARLRHALRVCEGRERASV